MSRPMLYGGLLVAAVAAFVMTMPKGTETADSPDPRGSRGASNGLSDGIFAYDYEAVFPALNESPNSAFKPLVERSGPRGGIAPNEFPAAYTGGEPGWFYTGTVVIDEVPSALVENAVTGDGMYLEVGEYLKSTTIMEITPTYIVVKGMTGRSLRLDLLRDLPEPGDEFEGLGIEPVRPDLSGVLGGPIRLPESPDTSEQS